MNFRHWRAYVSWKDRMRNIVLMQTIYREASRIQRVFAEWSAVAEREANARWQSDSRVSVKLDESRSSSPPRS